MPVRQIPLHTELLWSKSGVRPWIDVVQTPHFAALESHVRVSKRPPHQPASTRCFASHRRSRRSKAMALILTPLILGIILMLRMESSVMHQA
jgi:hypothetical protein